MSEEDKTDETETGSEEDEAADETVVQEGKTRKRFALKLPADRKKLVLYIAPVLLLLGGGIYFATSMTGMMGQPSSAKTGGAAKVYFDMPEMVVNLSATEKRSHYLKLKVALEASDQLTLDSLTPVMPRILDMFQLYLREMRSSDLEGSAGIYRLKEELLRRVNLEIHPKQIDRVLFKEIIVQ